VTERQMQSTYRLPPIDDVVRQHIGDRAVADYDQLIDSLALAVARMPDLPPIHRQRMCLQVIAHELIRRARR
jgi:hypothetical protein